MVYSFFNVGSSRQDEDFPYGTFRSFQKNFIWLFSVWKKNLLVISSWYLYIRNICMFDLFILLTCLKFVLFFDIHNCKMKHLCMTKNFLTRHFLSYCRPWCVKQKKILYVFSKVPYGLNIKKSAYYLVDMVCI